MDNFPALIAYLLYTGDMYIIYIYVYTEHHAANNKTSQPKHNKHCKTPVNFPKKTCGALIRFFLGEMIQFDYIIVFRWVETINQFCDSLGDEQFLEQQHVLHCTICSGRRSHVQVRMAQCLEKTRKMESWESRGISKAGVFLVGGFGGDGDFKSLTT